MNEVNRALTLAAIAHGDQCYGDGPYIVHLRHVVEVLRRFGIEDRNALIAAALHDVLEDTSTTAEQIEIWFGEEVTRLVWAVTNEPGSRRKERHLRTYPKIRKAGPLAVAIKLADRIANTEYSIAHGSGQLKMYRREFAEFSTALYRSGEWESMWAHLRKLSTGRADA
jgi:(p)ppGpp synthase/HD superfamily hydrolase